jgi:GNAT superfamily N-acetyltransferase
MSERPTLVHVELEDPGINDWTDYARVPIAFQVSRTLVPASDLNPLAFREKSVDSPWWKDYDTIPGCHPLTWPQQFDTSSWRVFSAWHGSRKVGGMVLIPGPSDFEMLEGRENLVLVWDLRVRPEWRGKGIGSALLRAAEQWAKSRGCAELKVETQNSNVAACGLYSRMGFTLRIVDPTAYPGLDEIRMLWYRSIGE